MGPISDLDEKLVYLLEAMKSVKNDLIFFPLKHCKYDSLSSFGRHLCEASNDTSKDIHYITLVSRLIITLLSATTLFLIRSISRSNHSHSE